MSWLDLHIHSSISRDGDISPRGLIELCAQEKLRVVALTDHNSVRGVAEAVWRGASFGVRVIPAIELDCWYEKRHLHILGYGIDITYKGFSGVEQALQAHLREVTLQQIDAIQALGIRVDAAAVMNDARDGIVTAEQIAEHVLHDPHNRKHPLFTELLPGGSRSDKPLVNFYSDICSPGKAAFVPVSYISASQAVELIHAAGGKAVLAHPGVSVGTEPTALEEILRLPLDGIEVYSSYHDAAVTAFFTEQASKHHMLMTGGSGFHGRNKPNIRAGAIGFDGREEEILAELLSN